MEISIAATAIAAFAGTVLAGRGGDSAGGTSGTAKKEVPVIGGSAAPKLPKKLCRMDQ